jgi:hypothetical protein
MLQTAGVLVELDREALAVMDFAVPVQLAIDMAKIVTNPVDLTTDAIAVMAIVQFTFDSLEVVANGFQFFVGAVIVAGAGFVVEMAVPLPQAVDVGAEVIVVIVGFHRGDGEQAGSNGKGQDGTFHRCLVLPIRGISDG